MSRGLGVPLWRLPFELLAKFSGVAAFPDRVALAAAIIVVSYALLARSLFKTERLVGALLLVLFPPFLTLCRTRFDVYEEAEAYMYLTGIAIFVLLLWFMRRPTLAGYELRPLLWTSCVRCGRHSLLRLGGNGVGLVLRQAGGLEAGRPPTFRCRLACYFSPTNFASAPASNSAIV